MVEQYVLVCENCLKKYPEAFPHGLTPHVLVMHQMEGARSKQCLNCGAIVKYPSQ